MQFGKFEYDLQSIFGKFDYDLWCILKTFFFFFFFFFLNSNEQTQSRGDPNMTKIRILLDQENS